MPRLGLNETRARQEVSSINLTTPRLGLLRVTKRQSHSLRQDQNVFSQSHCVSLSQSSQLCMCHQLCPSLKSQQHAMTRDRMTVPTTRQVISQSFLVTKLRTFQGGRTWQAFGGGKNGHETFREARIYNFRDKCVVFGRNLKFSNLTQ